MKRKPREHKKYKPCENCGLMLSQHSHSRARHLKNCEKLPPLATLSAEHANGRTFTSIAFEFGVSRSFVREQIHGFNGDDARARKNKAKRVNYALKGGGCAKCGIMFNDHDGEKPQKRVSKGTFCDMCLHESTSTRPPKTYYSSPREARTLI